MAKRRRRWRQHNGRNEVKTCFNHQIKKRQDFCKGHKHVFSTNLFVNDQYDIYLAFICFCVCVYVFIYIYIFFLKFS